MTPEDSHSLILIAAFASWRRSIGDRTAILWTGGRQRAEPLTASSFAQPDNDNDLRGSSRPRSIEMVSARQSLGMNRTFDGIR